MIASHLIAALQQMMTIEGDIEVAISVKWPYEAYLMDDDEPITAGAIESGPCLFIEAGDPA